MKNIIWMKTPKCGGTSMIRHLSAAARNTLGGNRDPQVLTFKNCRLFVILGAWHKRSPRRPIERFKDKYLEIFNNSWKFVFVRNPWDRLLSAYLYERPIGGAHANPGPRYPINEGQFLSFLSRPNLNSLLITPHKRPLYPRLADNNNMCDYFDFIGRFENLQKDYDFVCDQIGIPHSQLPYHNKTDHLPYWKYYNDQAQEIVARHYKKDIEYFGYEFRGIKGL